MTKASSGSSWTSFLVGPLFIVVGGLVALFVGKPTLDNARASASWPKITGQIVSSQVAQGTSRGKKRYWAAVKYSFERDGQQQIGDMVSFGASRSSNRSSQQAIVDRYPVGKQVDVYYSPEDADVSVLEPGVTLSSYTTLIIGIVFLGLGLVLTAAGVISKHRSAPAVATS